MTPATVAIILDGEFGDRLLSLPKDRPVWIADSATNRSVAEKVWRSEPSRPVTTFRYDPAISGAEVFSEVLPTIDLHHGSLSQSPPYQEIDVYGARPNQIVLAALEGIGFQLEEATPDGFRARAARLV